MQPDYPTSWNLPSDDTKTRLAKLCLGLLIADRIRYDKRGRARVYLGKGHPYAQKSGQQWLGRYLVQEALGRRLRSDEHCHHKNGDKADDRLENLEVVVAEYHGSLHASYVDLAGWRDDLGRFVERPQGLPYFVPRGGPIIGSSAQEYLSP